MGAPQLLDPSAKKLFDKWTHADEWACVAFMEPVVTKSSNDHDYLQALLVPVMAARSILLILPDRIATLPVNFPDLSIQPLRTLGLREAGLAEVQIRRSALPATAKATDPDRLARISSIVSSGDLTSIASGIAEELCRRAIARSGICGQPPGECRRGDRKGVLRGGE